MVETVGVQFRQRTLERKPSGPPRSRNRPRFRTTARLCRERLADPFGGEFGDQFRNTRHLWGLGERQREHVCKAISVLQYELVGCSPTENQPTAKAIEPFGVHTAVDQVSRLPDWLRERTDKQRLEGRTPDDVWCYRISPPLAAYLYAKEALGYAPAPED